MTYTIIAARYANAEHTAAVATTKEVADIVMSVADTPGEWAALLESGEPTTYVAPAAPVPRDPLAKLKTFLADNPDVARLLSD